MRKGGGGGGVKGRRKEREGRTVKSSSEQVHFVNKGVTLGCEEPWALHAEHVTGSSVLIRLVLLPSVTLLQEGGARGEDKREKGRGRRGTVTYALIYFHLLDVCWF